MFIVGIAGGSGSGKTTFAEKIMGQVAHPDLVLLHQDSYYLPQVPGRNFDHPAAFDWKLLKAQIERLRSGQSVQVPVYDFKKDDRKQETQGIGPCKVVLLEGIYALYDAEIRGLLDLKIFLHVESDIRFIRRLHRDVHERGRTLDGVIRQYYDSVRPMHYEHLDPTRQYADLVVGEETDIAAATVAAHVRQMLE